MESISESSATTITVAQTLSFMDQRFPKLSKEVADGHYAFWLGSGVSRNRFPGLPELVGKILEFLQEESDHLDEHCVFRQAFDAALRLADLSPEESEHSDLTRVVSDWSTFSTIVHRLVSKYSQLLEIEVAGMARDYILWDVVNVPRTYADESTAPDLEHLCLAVLALEGVLPEVVSANWDGLIERAVAELVGGPSSVLSVYVTSDDFRQDRGRSRLLKFHGCAVKAKEDEARYRSYLVGRRSQITDWPNDSSHTVMVQEMKTLAATRRTLMIGLSAQDPNIQNLFSSAKDLLTWEWPSEPPAFIFAEDAIGEDQKNILRVGYSTTYEGHESDIGDASLLRAFAKPLLAALVMSTLIRKLEILAGLAGTSVPAIDFIPAVTHGLYALRDIVSNNVDAGSEASVQRMISEIGRALALFRTGQIPSTSEKYQPLGITPASQIGSDPQTLASGLPQMALALSLLGSEHDRGTWALSVNASDGDKRAVLRAAAGTISSHLFFAANPTVAVRLELNGFADDSDGDLVVIHSTRRPLTQQRSPRSARGRTGARSARHVEMDEIISGAESLEDLERRFREELAL